MKFPLKISCSPGVVPIFIFVWLVFFSSLAAANTVLITSSSGEDCSQLDKKDPQKSALMTVNGASEIWQNNFLGGCTALWVSQATRQENLVLLVGSNHPREILFPSENKAIQKIRYDTPVSERPYRYRFYAIPLKYYDNSKPIYIIQRGVFNVPISIVTEEELASSENQTNFLGGATTALWVIAFLVSMTFYILSRQSAFLAYCLLISASGMMIFAKTGFGQSYLWVSLPELTDTFVSWSAPLAALAILMILKKVLRADDLSSQAFRIAICLGIVAILSTTIRLAFGWDELENIIQLLLVPPFVISVVVILRNCFKTLPVETSLVGLAIAGLVTGVVMSSLSNIGVITNSVFATRAAELGGGFDLLIGIILVGYQVYADNARANQLGEKVLRLHEEREAELSKRVEEKTSDLEKLNNEKKKLLIEFYAYSRYLTHDVRNPLANIKNQNTLLKHHTDDPEVNKRIDVMERSITRVTNLFDDWLLMQRMSLGFHQVSNQYVALRGFIYALMDEVAFRDQVTLEFTFQEEVTVLWDASLVKRVIHNLLDNAKRHGDSSRGFVLQVGVDDRFVTISVVDFGLTSFAEIRARLWETSDYEDDRFELRNESGLGSALVAKAIDILGGRVEYAASDPGSEIGLNATILLPIEIKNDS